MEHLNNVKTAMLVAVLFLFGWGCGVKGRPLPPTNPPPLGRGQSAYSTNKNKTPIKNKYDASQDEEPSETEERK